MILARELDPSSDQVVEYWLRKRRKGDDDALKPKSKGRPKGSAKPKMLTEEESVSSCLCVGLGL